MFPHLPALCSAEAGRGPLWLFIAVSHGVERGSHHLSFQCGAPVSQAAVSIRVHVFSGTRVLTSLG